MKQESKKKDSSVKVGCVDFADKKRDYDLPDNFLEQKLSEDGNSYVDITFEHGIKFEKTVFECGKNGVTKEWLLELDSLDGGLLGNEIDAGRLTDFGYGRSNKKNKDVYIYLHSSNDQKSVHERAFPEEKKLSPLEQVVHDVVEKCSECQKFVYDLRCNRQIRVPFPVIAELYTEHFGTPTSEDGVEKLYHKIELKVCKALGVEYPRKRKIR